MKLISGSLIGASLVISLTLIPWSASAQTGLFQQAQTTQALGRALGAAFTAGTPEGSQTLQSASTLEILGASLQALNGSISIPNTPDAASTMEFYSFGKRIFSQTFYAQNDGLLGGKIGLAPAEVRVPLVTYPVGPLLLEIDGGVRFQADLEGHLTPTIIIPSTLSNITAELQADASGAGFIEGYAELLAIRGGVGGQVDLINASADATSEFFFDGGSPVTSVSAMVQFLAGSFYAFIDYFNVLQWSWSNLWNYDLYSWTGICYSTGSLSCPQK